MPNTKKSIAGRYGKFLLCNIPGTMVDLLVCWFFAHIVFHYYVGQYVISPLISYECAIVTDFVLCYFFVWGELIGPRRLRTFWKHLIAYNLSAIGAFFLKDIIILLTEHLFEIDVIWCNAIAMTFSGSFNFFINERFNFRKKKQSDPRAEEDSESLVEAINN